MPAQVLCYFYHQINGNLINYILLFGSYFQDVLGGLFNDNDHGASDSHETAGSLLRINAYHQKDQDEPTYTIMAGGNAVGLPDERWYGIYLCSDNVIDFSYYLDGSLAQ